MSDEWRVEFDAEVTFHNGGSLRAEDFRLDIAGDDITDDELAALFVRHLGLLMTDRVRISNKRLLREPHKGSRHAPAAATARRLVPLHHVIRDGMITHPGIPGPHITDHMSREASRARYAEGTEFQIGHISMVANTGTYLDTPFHRFDGGLDMAAMPLESMADLPGICVRAAGIRAIDSMLLLPHDVRGRAVLLHTGWSSNWGSERYGVESPFLTRDGATWLVEQGAALVGIDSVNIDDLGDRTRPAHTLLLAAGIPIVEHMRGLEDLPPDGFRLHAAPAPIEGMGTFPVRAYAVIGG